MKVVFATPMKSSTPSAEFNEASIRTETLLRMNGVQVVWNRVEGDPYVHKARNQLGSVFLLEHTDADVLAYLDDDVGWDPLDALRFLGRPEDIICGIYPKKDDDLAFPVEVLRNSEGRVVTQNGLYAAALAPTGFMFIKRHVMERCAEDSGRYPQVDKTVNGKREIWCWDFFRTGFVPD